jgi:hypothetical protein
MNKIQGILLASLGAAAALFSGCEIATVNEPGSSQNSANSLVINEVMIQAPPSQNPYYWIELYNPTGHPVDITGWKLRFKTTQVRYDWADTAFTFPPRGVHSDDVVRYYSVDLTPKLVMDTIDVPGARGSFNAPASIEANNFVVLVSDEATMLTYTEYGHGSGITVNSSFVSPELRYFFRHDTVRTSTGQDSIISVVKLDTAVTVGYTLGFTTVGQILLLDANDVARDVFRYGNFVYDDTTASATDPYPYNFTIGSIVPFQSFARYRSDPSGAYTSGAGGNAALGNSAADFYITGSGGHEGTRPIPRWLSQSAKK